MSALALCQDQTILVAMQDGFGSLDERTGAVSLLAPVEHRDVTTRLNDGKCDRRGRFWAGSMAFDFAQGRGTLYCLEPDEGRTVRSRLCGLTLSNGLAWSADDRTLYFIDSATRRIDAIDFDLESGALGKRRPWVTVEEPSGMPDGMTIDTDGGLWVAMWGGGAVHRFAPDGRLDEVVRVPASLVTCCTFGGPALDVLYITTAADLLDDTERSAQPHAGSVFAATVGAVGLPSDRFGR